MIWTHNHLSLSATWVTTEWLKQPIFFCSEVCGQLIVLHAKCTPLAWTKVTELHGDPKKFHLSCILMDSSGMVPVSGPPTFAMHGVGLHPLSSQTL